MSGDFRQSDMDLFRKFLADMQTKDSKFCTHCFLESHLRAYLEVMADEPDEFIKMSTIYHNLKAILDGNE